MKQPVRRIERLMEAANVRTQLEQRFQVSASELGVLRAISSAFGHTPPPLPGIEGPELDIREEYVMRLVEANQ